ncbi:MAG TPA: ABC transporter permease [Vicinamibacterales bacterium]|nr:ABC transporter permease [Vicinamibacterales bacterium]
MSIPNLRHAVRHLRQSPGYTATAIVTFALAIGANSAIFSAVNAVLLRPLPVESPDRLAVVWQTDAGGQAVVELTYRHLREWTQAGNTFTDAAVMGSHNWSAVLHGRGEPSRTWFNGVSAGFFETLGARPLLGRGFRDDDDVPNARAVAVLNHGTWVRRFGADPAIVGTTMTLDGNSVEIVGVMPPGFDFPQGAEFWRPVVPFLVSGAAPDTSILDRVGVFYVLGRVRGAVDAAALRHEVNALEARLDAADTSRFKWGASAVITPFLDHVFGPVRPALRVLWAAVAVLLLVACANISGLMLTRISRRRQENGIRLALGATPAAVGRLWLSEVVVVAIAGGALGLAIAQWIAQAIVTLAPDDLPRVGDISIDGTVALFTFVAVLVVALVTAAIPLRHAGRASLLSACEGERSTAGRAAIRVQSTLLVVQIGLAVVLLVGAGLVLRSFIALRQIDLGFAPQGVLSLTVRPGSTERTPNLWMDDFLARVRTLPGVEAAGAVYLRPLMLGPIGDSVRVLLEGQPPTEETAAANPTLNYQVATPGYFETLEIPLRAGRLFTDRDTSNIPRVAIVSESTARRLWPGQDPLGKRLVIPTYSADRESGWRTVVGVVRDVRYRGLHEVQPDVYDPALQATQVAANVVIRSAHDPLGLAAPVRALARRLDPTAVVDSVTTMEAVVERAEAPWRLTMWMFVSFAGLAFGLAALGLFSVVALDVANRGREFAIRIALGESPAGILRAVLLRAGRRVLAGLALGLGTAVVSGRAIRGLLFDVAPDDGLTYAAVLVAVLTAVAAAAYLPARRAAAADPQSLLRQG